MGLMNTHTGGRWSNTFHVEENNSEYCEYWVVWAIRLRIQLTQKNFFLLGCVCLKPQWIHSWDFVCSFNLKDYMPLACSYSKAMQHADVYDSQCKAKPQRQLFAKYLALWRCRQEFIKGNPFDLNQQLFKRAVLTYLCSLFNTDQKSKSLNIRQTTHLLHQPTCKSLLLYHSPFKRAKVILSLDSPADFQLHNSICHAGLCHPYNRKATPI